MLARAVAFIRPTPTVKRPSRTPRRGYSRAGQPGQSELQRPPPDQTLLPPRDGVRRAFSCDLFPEDVAECAPYRVKSPRLELERCGLESLRDWEGSDADTGKDLAREIREY